MDFLHKLLNRAGNIVRNDVINPLQRDIVRPAASGERYLAQSISKPYTQLWQHLNPNSGYNRAKPIVQQAESRYGFSPAFAALVRAGNPSIGNKFDSSNGLLDKNITPAAEYDRSNLLNSLQLGNYKGNQATDYLLHEGLHRQWQLYPHDHQNFINAYTKGATPRLRQYLATRLAGYKQFDSGNNRQLMNINLANPNIQNEIHSYIPEYSGPLPVPLANYYSQFYDPNKRQSYDNTAGYIMRNF